MKPVQRPDPVGKVVNQAGYLPERASAPPPFAASFPGQEKLGQVFHSLFPGNHLTISPVNIPGPGFRNKKDKRNLIAPIVGMTDPG